MEIATATLRALLSLVLPQLHAPGYVGSMVYGNTVDYTRDMVRNQSVLSAYLLVDIAAQLRRPTGGAINPVPLTENLRIPDAADILEVHRLAREIEREACRSGDIFAWDAMEADAAIVSTYNGAAPRQAGRSPTPCGASATTGDLHGRRAQRGHRRRGARRRHRADPRTRHHLRRGHPHAPRRDSPAGIGSSGVAIVQVRAWSRVARRTPPDWSQTACQPRELVAICHLLCGTGLQRH